MELYVFVSFPKPRPHVTLSDSFLQGYFTDFIKTFHDCCFGHYAVWKGRWLTLTYFSRSQRSNFDIFFRVFVYFVIVYCLDSCQTLHDYCCGQYIVYRRKFLILTYFWKVIEIKFWTFFPRSAKNVILRPNIAARKLVTIEHI